MDIEESIKWLLRAETIFGKLFYDALFERHSELRRFFHDVDISHQAVLLTMQLSVIGQCYPHPPPAVDAYLHILGTKRLSGNDPLFFSVFLQCKRSSAAIRVSGEFRETTRKHRNDCIQERRKTWCFFSG